MFGGTDAAYALAKKFRYIRTAWGTDILFDAANAARQGAMLPRLVDGTSPAHSLSMATSGNAQLLALSGLRTPYAGTLGVVEEGALADLLLVDGNPIENITLIARSRADHAAGRSEHAVKRVYDMNVPLIVHTNGDATIDISPMRDAIDAGLHPTNHTDFYVAPLDQMFMMWSAVNRVSREGGVLGPGQRITPMEAIKPQTIWAAEQYDEQASRGSLVTGKIADLVILDKNPLKVEPMAIKDIRVLETFKEGRSVYRRP